MYQCETGHIFWRQLLEKGRKTYTYVQISKGCVEEEEDLTICSLQFRRPRPTEQFQLSGRQRLLEKICTRSKTQPLASYR